MTTNMVEATCHCGDVKLTAPAPATVFDCTCSICRRYGGRWAYYQRPEVTITGATEIYLWNKRWIEFHRCKKCGCLTHWLASDPKQERMAINARMMAPDVLDAAELKVFDGARS